ncbi:hypothetical protein Tco_0296426 [Tanacetum coccineum]
MPHELPLHSVHSLGRDEGSLSLNELTDLCTSLSKKVEGLEFELKQTKKTYSTAIIKLIFSVKKLEKKVKTTKARRRARIVLSKDEEDVEDSSKQGRKISAIDKDPTISLEDAEIQEKNSADTEILLQEEEPNELVEDQFSNASANLVYIRRSAQKRKDKGKAIMQESEPPKKVKKRVQVQMSMDEELAKKVFEEEQAKAMAEQEQERINFEAALELQKQLDEREEVAAEPTQAQQIDWSDPAVLRYHAQLNRPYSVAEVRKNMVMYLKNQGGYKMNYFKGMKYEDIRPIFEKVWDQIQSFAPMDSEKEKDSEKKGSRKKSLARKRAGEKQSEESTKRQKIEDDVEKEELKAYLDLVPREEFAMEIESLATKYPIVDWKTHVLTENFMYYQIFRADGSSKNYKIFSEMLDDFDRQDVLDLHRLVKARYMTSSPEGYDLMLWGDLKILFEPDEEDEEMLSRMLSKRLEVDHESTMAYELLKFIKSQLRGRKAHSLGDMQVPSVGEIQVTWAQFWKKPDKIAIGHKEGTKNQSQKVDTTSGNLVTPSASERDRVRRNSDDVRIKRHKRNPRIFIGATIASTSLARLDIWRGISIRGCIDSFRMPDNQYLVSNSNSQQPADVENVSTVTMSHSELASAFHFFQRVIRRYLPCLLWTSIPSVPRLLWEQ